uniref:Uncharacterized protein n=1 Tax=Oryza sativa subsp. japonica TaxID=39947 RepID=Q69UY5_ORYSJ|nr:hypothetical protein [Oryza sativa Japonica Group]
MKQCFSIQEPSAAASIQPSVAAIVHASRSPLPNATRREQAIVRGALDRDS